MVWKTVINPMLIYCLMKDVVITTYFYGVFDGLYPLER